MIDWTFVSIEKLHVTAARNEKKSNQAASTRLETPQEGLHSIQMKK